MGLCWAEGAAMPGPFPTGGRCEPPTRTSLSLCRACPPEGRSGSHRCGTERDRKWIPILPFHPSWGCRLGGPRSSSACLPVPKDLSSWAPSVGRAHSQGLTYHRASELEGPAGYPPTHTSLRPASPGGSAHGPPSAPASQPRPGLTCAPAVCSPASACSSGPRCSGCHSPALSPSSPENSPTVGGQGWGGGNL